MQRPDRGAWRLVRAAAVASTVVGLAAAAHVVAGGVLPGPWLLLGLSALVLCGALLLAGRRMSAPVLLAVLGAGQVGLHQVFCWLGVETVPVHAPSGADHLLAGHDPGLSAGWSTGVVPDVAHAGAATSADASMTVAHVLATVACALVLARGESLLWRLWTWWQPVRAVVVAVLRLPVPPRVPPVPAAPAPRPSFVVARRVPRRGPPRVPALASTTG